MKRSIPTIICFLFLFSSFLSAQFPLAPLGAKWVTNHWTGCCDFVMSWDQDNCIYQNCIPNIQVIRSEEVVDVGGKECSLLRVYRGPKEEELVFIDIEIIVYEEDKQYFFWFQDSFYLYMDFNLEVGDTLTFHAPPYWPTLSLEEVPWQEEEFEVVQERVIVKTISDLNPGSISPKVYEFDFDTTQNQDLQGPGYIYTRIIEGIGCVGGLFGTAKGLVANGCHGAFICYQDENFSHHFQDDCECEVPVSINEIPSLEFSVSPNPVLNYLNIEIPSNEIHKIELYNTQGVLQLYSELQTQAKIPMDGLPNGIYILKIYNEKGFGVKSIIKL